MGTQWYAVSSHMIMTITEEAEVAEVRSSVASEAVASVAVEVVSVEAASVVEWVAAAEPAHVFKTSFSPLETKR